VALVLPAGIDLMVTALGVLLAGCSVLSVDAGAPEPYRARLLQAAKPQLLIAADERAAGESSAALLKLSELTVAEPAASYRGARPEDAAWLRVSFGADGVPVISRLAHSELAARVQGALGLLAPRATSLFAYCDPLAENLPLALLLGPALAVPTQLVSREGELEAAFAKAGDGVPCLFAPAALIASLLAAGAPALERTRVLLDGGGSADVLKPLLAGVKQVVGLRASAPPASLLFGAVLARAEDAGLLGRALGSGALVVLDHALGSLPIGVVGEICVDAEPPFRTGLQGRLRADGRVELLADAQEWVVVAGQRFSPAQVARSLEQHPAVKQAAARVAHEQGADRVVAYFVANRGVDYTDTELRRHVRAALPEPCVPQLFIELPSLPLAADGSVDLAALPEPFGGSSRHEYVAPRNEVERVVAQLYAEALGLERVSVYDNFFDLGGHSLLCFRVIEQIEHRVGKRLSPRTVLLSSLEQVAAQLGTAGAAPTPSQAAQAPVPAPSSESMTGRVFKKLTGLLRR
jgi:hypothetical protein